MEITWDEIYSIWKNRCSWLHKPILSGSNFKNIEIDNKENLPLIYQQSYNRFEELSFLDWWLKEDYEDLNNSKDNVQHSFKRKGHLITAEMLWEYKNDLEKTALIWIGASLYNINKNYLLEGEAFSLAEDLWFTTVMKKFKEEKICTWNSNTKNTLPVNLFSYYSYNKTFKPETIKGIIDLVALESIYIYTTWQLVHIKYK